MKRIHFIWLLILFASCEKDDYYTPPPSGKTNADLLEEADLSDYQRDVIRYFSDIALGFEFENSDRITRKWASDMKVYISGGTTEILLNELDGIIDELDDLMEDDISIEFVDDIEDSNYHIFIGSADDYSALYPEVSGNVPANWGLFYVNWDSNNNLIRGHMYVNNELANEIEQRHLLREEFTQSFGLARDSNEYATSIFQSSWTTTTSYAEIDRDLIRLLYNPSIKSGMSESQLIPILINILEMDNAS